MSSKKRIAVLDELRGFAVVAMVIIHAFYLWYNVFGFEWAKKPGETFINPFIAAIFIVVSGISCSLTKSNVKRGVKVLLIALALTASTVFILPLINLRGLEIYFGILHFLGCCMLLFVPFRPLVEKTNAVVGLAVCIVLYAVTFNIGSRCLGVGAWSLDLPAVLYSTDWLCPFGFHTSSFYSSDYYPLLPHVFMFFTGAFVGKMITKKQLPDFAYKTHLKSLSFLGRHSLVIYVAHQPVLFALTWLAVQLL